MATQRKDRDRGTFHLFDLDSCLGEKQVDGSNLEFNLWTHQKAELIARYLWSFLAVTKNGIYIDAFAGPQDPATSDKSWSAKKVLEMESRFLSRACLFELDESKIPALQQLAKRFDQGWTRLWKRQVLQFHGDSNVLIPDYLRKHPFKPNKAGFALLDQRTHECKWDLVQSLADHKKSGTKIELFYFLAQGWMDRSVKSSTRPEKIKEIDEWYGPGDWGEFMQKGSFERAAIWKQRFVEKLGYKYAKAFPMKERGNDGRIMFWLIHASDHPRAIPLMDGAYRSIGLSWTDEEWKQVVIDDLLKDAES